MPKEKDRKEKYWLSPEVEAEAKKIVEKCNDVFGYITLADFKFFFTKTKAKADKNIKVKILKQPITLVTNKKVLVFTSEEWWNDQIDSDRTKALIETFLGISGSGNEGDTYDKRDYDYFLFKETAKGNGPDFSKFSNILPAEGAKQTKKVEDLVLTN